MTEVRVVSTVAAGAGVGVYPAAGVWELRLLAAVVFGSALGAYALGPVPVQWLVHGLLCGAVVLMVAFTGTPTLPGGALVWSLVAWLAVVTFTSLPEVVRWAGMMPPRATTPYWLFVVLRFVDFFVFLAAAYLVTRLLREYGRDRVLRLVVWCGTAVALLAVYVYIAQTQGLPEPGRTRMGTGGETQAVQFAYGFHRAMGTFREPSFLAEWLIVPLFFSVAVRGGRWLNAPTLLMAVVLLLTGSLTGLLGAFGGLAVGILLAGVLSLQSLKHITAIVIVFIVTLQLFRFLAIEDSAALGADFLFVISQRIGPLLQEGLGGSNRAYVYEYVGTQVVPLWGLGLGNANIALTAAVGTPAMSSHLSLYLNTLFSGGVVALVLLLTFLLRPVAGALVRPALRRRPEAYVLIAAYVSWLIMYAVHSEYPSLMFGVAYAVFAAEVRESPLGRVAAWSVAALRSAGRGPDAGRSALVAGRQS